MKKVWKTVRITLTWLLVVTAVAMMVFTVVSVNTFDRNDRDLFGYKAYIVRSDSMSSVNGDVRQGYFDAGDLIFVKEVDPVTLKAGDIIAYTSTNTENFGETVTHRIQSLTVDATGEPGFITYGTATGAADANVVTYPYVLGQYTGKIPNAGTFFHFLQTTPGYIVCILIPFLLLIGLQGINSIRIFRQYKQEQLAELEAQRAAELAELEAQRAAIEAERKRQEAMMQKLLEMQAALQGEAQSASSSAAEETKTAT